MTMTPLQREQLTAHLQRLLNAVDQSVHTNAELLCVLVFLLTQTLQRPVRRGHKTNINQAYALQGARIVPPALLDKGFNRAVVKLAQDVIEQHSRSIFDVQVTADDFRPGSSNSSDTLSSLRSSTATSPAP